MNRVKPRPTGVRAALIPALAITAVALLPALLRPWIRVRADARLHAAVVAEIEAFGLPPQDPYFAGIQLQYMWFFHALIAAIRRLVPVSTFDLMVALNALALVVTIVAAAWLAGRLGRAAGHGAMEATPAIESPPRFPPGTGDPDALARRASTWSLVLFPFALGALFWIFLPLRALRATFGSSSGGEEFARLFRLTPFDVPTTRAFLSELGSFPFFLNKFLVGSAYGPALAAFLVYMAACVRYMERPGLRPLLVAGPALAAALHFHPVIGLTAAAVSGLVGIALLVLGPRRGGLPFGKLLGWGLAVATALVVSLPYLSAVTAQKTGAPLAPIRFEPANLVALLVGCDLVLLLALGPARRFWTGATPPGRFIVLWSVMTLVFTSVIQLPPPNTIDKFTYLLYVPLASMAAVGAARFVRSRARAVLLVLVLVPVNAIAWGAYWLEPDGREKSPDVLAAYDWLASETSRESIVIDSNERCDVLAFVPRRQYWGRLTYAEQWGYDAREIARRSGALEQLYGSAPLDSVALAPLSTVSAPLYILVRQADLGQATFGGWGQRFRGRAVEVFARPGIRIYRYGGMISQ